MVEASVMFSTKRPFAEEGLDLTMASIGFGAYQGGVTNPPKSYTAVVELGYRYQINGWAYTQPFFQYFARPNGTTEVANAAVLGVLAGLVF